MNIDDEGKLVYEFVFTTKIAGSKPAQQVYHTTSDALANPDVAIYDPYNVSFCLAIASAHVPDLRIRTEVVSLSIATKEIGILLFNQYLGIEGREIGQQALKNGIRRVIA